MVELPDVDLLPVDEVVTGEAVLPKSSLMLILVASNTRRGNAQVSPVRILDSN